MSLITQKLIKPISECTSDELSVRVRQLCEKLKITYVAELIDLAEEDFPGSSQENRDQIKEYLALCGVEEGFIMPKEVRNLIET